MCCWVPSYTTPDKLLYWMSNTIFLLRMIFMPRVLMIPWPLADIVTNATWKSLRTSDQLRKSKHFASGISFNQQIIFLWNQDEIATFPLITHFWLFSQLKQMKLKNQLRSWSTWPWWLLMCASWFRDLCIENFSSKATTEKWCTDHSCSQSRPPIQLNPSLLGHGHCVYHHL